ncbi:hypothetical protein, partial [Arachidicoccus sp.]|uniref:hypothetical protein n=1 Tax=Arachidicoccus sp. TaxID=1872624 RepID=UPI003D2577F6
MKNFFRNYFLFILFSLFFVKATGEKKTNIYGYNNNIRLYLTSGLIDASVRNYMNSNGIGEVKIIGQAAIDPKNNLTLNVELLKRGILLKFPRVSGKG